MTIQKGKRNWNERGTAVVEAAVVLPIFFLLLFGVFEAGRFMQTQQTVTDAAREGARLAVAPMSGTNTLGTAAEVDTVVQQFLSSSGVTGSVTVFDTNVVVNGTTYTHVKVDAPYNIFTIADLSMFNVTLHGDALMRNETSD